jgi:hypothetical protein
MTRWTAARLDRLYERADAILDGRANGLGLPILEALNIRRHLGARNYLATILSDPFKATAVGRSRGKRLTLTNMRTGGAGAMYNLAIQYRNEGDLRLYRYWLARAAGRDHDPYHTRELRFFETRFPHEVMRRFGRIRPYRKRDDWQCD